MTWLGSERPNTFAETPLTSDFGQRPLHPKHVWANSARLELAGYLRDLAPFNLAIDCKRCGRDLIKLKVIDLVKEERLLERVSAFQNCRNLPQDRQPSRRASSAQPHKGPVHSASLRS